MSKTVTVFGAIYEFEQFWPEYYMLEPVMVMGNGSRVVSWSTGRDVSRIIPHLLAHPLPRNAICPLAATAYRSWDKLLELRERTLGRQVARMYLGNAEQMGAYDRQPVGAVKELMAIGILATEGAEGISPFANWNRTLRSRPSPRQRFRTQPGGAGDRGSWWRRTEAITRFQVRSGPGLESRSCRPLRGGRLAVFRAHHSSVREYPIPARSRP